MGANFSRGTKEGDRWILTPEEFGQVVLILPTNYAGTVDLEITAVADTGASRHRSLIIDVQSLTTEPPMTMATTEHAPATEHSTATADTTEEMPDMTRVTPNATDTVTKDGEFRIAGCCFLFNCIFFLFYS